jgi:hypothetical protein
MVKARLLVAALAAVAAGSVASPAHALAPVHVTFGLSAGQYAPTGTACSLTVDGGADGLAVLDAAQAAHCIVSYRTVSFPDFGTFVTCIDEVCGQVATGASGTYWNMYDNGTSAAYGVDGFVADEGDELVFAYQAYCFEVVCPGIG